MEYEKLLSMEREVLDEMRKLQKTHMLICSLKERFKPREYIEYSDEDCQE